MKRFIKKFEDIIAAAALAEAGESQKLPGKYLGMGGRSCWR